MDGSVEQDLGDVTLFELPALTLASETIKCWGDPPPYVEEFVEGDMDGDGIRDKISFKPVRGAQPSKAVLTVTASSTGKESSIRLGPEYEIYEVSFAGTAPVDGRPGVEAVIRGIVGNRAYAIMLIVTLKGGVLRVLPPPGDASSITSFWYDSMDQDSAQFYNRRIDGQSIIVSEFYMDFRTYPYGRETEVMTIEQFRWSQGEWVRIANDTYTFPYPATVLRDFDLSPYGESVGSQTYPW
jgi:hypothetical protein